MLKIKTLVNDENCKLIYFLEVFRKIPMYKFSFDQSRPDVCRGLENLSLNQLGLEYSFNFPRSNLTFYNPPPLTSKSIIFLNGPFTCLTTKLMVFYLFLFLWHHKPSPNKNIFFFTIGEYFSKWKLFDIK